MFQCIRSFGWGARLALFCLFTLTGASAEQRATRPFTVADDIALTQFGGMGYGETVSFSADRNYFVVWSERGRLDVNRVEDSLRFYRSHDVSAFLETSENPPSPIWVISRLAETGGVIDKWRWLPDSKGLVFRQRIDESHRQLVLADLSSKSVKPLTQSTEDVNAFEVQDRQHYTYTTEVRAPVAKTDAAASVGTGHTLQELILGDTPGQHHTHFWKVAGGKRFEIKQTDFAVLQGHNPGQPLKTRYNDLEIMVEQGLDDPPVLVAKNRKSSRVLWDPNPQLNMLDLGQASVYTWKDKDGRERRAGLYKPSDYKRGQRYPLVIQTHDFVESLFSPAGSILTSTYAAREMAAAGIVVLQIGEDCPSGTKDDAPCAVSAYESAVSQLVSDGVADLDRVGIVAFSWPSFYVMDFLTTTSFHIKAALISSGQFMGDYFQYMAFAETVGQFRQTTESVIGAAPFGDGLQQWLKNSPTFHLDRMTTPLMMVAQDRLDVLAMWAPYAGLHYLRRPVDLVLLNHAKGHVLTNPSSRILSQGATVDWFRFWLHGYEDPDPSKAEQYKRWRGMRQMQEESEKQSAARANNN